MREARAAIDRGDEAMHALVERLAARFVPLVGSVLRQRQHAPQICARGASSALSYERSIAAFARAKRVIPGGVNSPVRAFRAVGLSPIFMKSGSGAILHDLDDHEYIDYVLSWGPLMLGHAHPASSKRSTAAAARGTSFGTPTEMESELAELIVSMVRSIERAALRFERHRSDDERAAARARLHAPPEDRQVRGLLSRSRAMRS